MTTLPTTIVVGDPAHITAHDALHTVYNLLTTKGDLLVATGAQAYARQPVGTAGQVLTADSTQADGLGYATPYGAKISEVVLGASSATIDFSTIPATYRELRLVALVRSTDAGTDDDVFVRVNGDAGANYDAQFILDTASAISAVDGVGLTNMASGNLSIPAGGAPANVAGVLELTFPGYRSGFHKPLLFRAFEKYNTGAGNMKTQWGSGLWRNTAAINRVTLTMVIGQFATGSIASLYGIF